MISLKNVSKSFDQGKTFIVKDVSIEIEPGETLVLLGSSGSGKTTILKMINRLIEPTSGTIEINHKNIKDKNEVQLRRSIGYVFQGIGLFSHMTIEENIGIVLRLNKVSKKNRILRSWELMEMVNLDPNEFAKRLPHQLSGGQRQRVGVARALASDPHILLMDEPFGALDAVTRDALQMELLNLKHRIQKTIVFVTHDILEALRLGDRIAIMNEGKLEQVGDKKEIINNPKTLFVKELFEKIQQRLEDFTGYFHG